VMDYLCGKFSDCSFSRFGFIVRTDRQTDTMDCTVEIDRHTHTHTQRDAAERLTHATAVGGVAQW